jgi:hypothetical protein
MTIALIKIKDGVVTVGYTTAGGAKIQTIKDERNPPHAAFCDAMRLLMRPVAEACGWQATEADRMALRSMTVKQTEDRHGDETDAVSITVELGNIQTAEKNATVKLPVLYTEATLKGCRMPGALRAEVDTVLTEAAAYVAALTGGKATE